MYIECLKKMRDPSCSVVLRIQGRAGELCALPDDLLDCIEEVSLRSDLSPCSNGKHPSLSEPGEPLSRTFVVTAQSG